MNRPTPMMIEALDEAAFGDVWVTLLDAGGNREINAPLIDIDNAFSQFDNIGCSRWTEDDDGSCSCGECAIIKLPDGYNGATMEFYAEPVEVDGDLIKLQCSAPGKSHLIRWARKSDINR